MKYYIYKNEVLGIVGEPGSGKSVSTLAIMRLLPKGISEVNSDEILFENRELINSNDLQSIRGIYFTRLSCVKYMSDNLLVMNKGIIEEEGEADTIYANPKKDYTKKLIDAIPKGL